MGLMHSHQLWEMLKVHQAVADGGNVGRISQALTVGMSALAIMVNVGLYVSNRRAVRREVERDRMRAARRRQLDLVEDLLTQVQSLAFNAQQNALTRAQLASLSAWELATMLVQVLDRVSDSLLKPLSAVSEAIDGLLDCALPLTLLMGAKRDRMVVAQARAADQLYSAYRTAWDALLLERGR